MPGKLKNFLSELAVSPEKLAGYQKNPDEAMKAAGLDADECGALKSGDPAKVYASLSGQSASGGQTQSTGAAAPQAGANCIWGAQPQANCIWQAQPQANCIWQAQPQANCIWQAQPQSPTAAQPYTIFVHHFIHTVPPQPDTPAPAPPTPSQPRSQSPKGGSTTGVTS